MTPDCRKSTLAPRRAPLAALCCALGLGGALFAGAADATLHADGGARVDDQARSLVLPDSGDRSYGRRTAVADPDLNGVVTALEAARYYETRFELLDENQDRAIHGPEFLRAVVVSSLYALDGFALPRPLAFESVDVDANGALTQEEFLRAELLRRSLAGETDARRQAIFEIVDVNRDGRAQRAGIHGHGREEFGSADGDGNGKVTVWEFYAATRL